MSEANHQVFHSSARHEFHSSESSSHADDHRRREEAEHVERKVEIMTSGHDGGHNVHHREEVFGGVDRMAGRMIGSSYHNTGYNERHREESESLERMAGRMIEQAMTSVVVRVCWLCRRRFVKTVGCSTVVCVCGASTCYRCGERLDQRHKCQLWLPEVNRHSLRRAAWQAKRNLRHYYPGLKFKYDPSRRFARNRRNRNRRNRAMTH